MSDHSSGVGRALVGLAVGLLGVGVAVGAGLAALVGLGCG